MWRESRSRSWICSVPCARRSASRSRLSRTTGSSWIGPWTRLDSARRRAGWRQAGKRCARSWPSSLRAPGLSSDLELEEEKPGGPYPRPAVFVGVRPMVGQPADEAVGQALLEDDLGLLHHKPRA